MTGRYRELRLRSNKGHIPHRVILIRSPTTKILRSFYCAIFPLLKIKRKVFDVEVITVWVADESSKISDRSNDKNSLENSTSPNRV